MPMRTVLGFVAYVADTGTGKPTILKGAQGKVYSVNDKGLTTPIACRDLATEAVIPNPVSNEDGYIGGFKVSISESADGILWVAGEYAIYQPFLGVQGPRGIKGDLGGLDSPALAIVNQARADAAAAEIKAASLVARANSGEFDGQNGSNGSPGLPGVNAVKNDAAVAAYVESGSSETRAALSTGFIDRRGIRGTSRTIYVRATGSDSNSGQTSSSAFREIRTAVASLAADGPVIRGSVVFDVGAGSYKGGILFPQTRTTSQDDFIKIIGPNVGGHPNVPTAIIDKAADTTATSGIFAGDGKVVWVENILVRGAFSSSVDVRRASYLQWRNVHIDGQGAAQVGLNIVNQSRYNPTGGIIRNCVIGVSELFGIVRDYSAAQTSAEATRVENCTIGVKAKENCVGHFDYLNISDCQTGLEMQLYSGGNMKGVLLKRNALAIALTNSEIHNENSIAWGSGADANVRRILSVGNSSELALTGWLPTTGDTAPTIRTGHRPLVLLASSYEDTAISGATSEKIVSTFPGLLRADWYAIKGKHAKVTVWGTTGSTLLNPMRILLRIGGNLFAEMSLPSGTPNVSHFQLAFDMVAIADGAAQKIMGTLTCRDAPTQTYVVSRTFDMSAADRAVTIAVIAGNTADSATFKLVEVWG